MDLEAILPVPSNPENEEATLRELHLLIEPFLKELSDDAVRQGWPAEHVGAVFGALGSQIMISYCGPPLTLSVVEQVAAELRRVIGRQKDASH